VGYAFISYSTKNQASADAMRDLFNKHNIDTWMAPYDIPAGSKYAAVITKAIRDCSCFVLLLSNDSQASEAVDSEVELAALTFKKSIITVELEKVILNDAFTFYIHNKQIIAVHKIDKDSSEIKQILEAVKAYTNADDETNIHSGDAEAIVLNKKTLDDVVENIENSGGSLETNDFLDINIVMNLLTTKTLSEVDIKKIRSQSNIAKSLAVPVGKDLGGNTVLLDLSCKKDGSNGIIFGPEGCGNEQFIYTFFVLLSLFFSPEDVQLHIVDLWNDNQTKLMQRLPHVGECLIQDNNDCVETFIDMFRQEEAKRKELFAQYNVSNIYQYLNLRESNKNSMPPLPHIIIGIKEIRYFKPEYPNAFEELNQFARKADILGIHCLYSTHFFDGIVDESVYNNADFKLCSVSQHDLLDPDSKRKVIPDRFYLQSQLQDNICEIQLTRFPSRTINSGQENTNKPNNANWFLNQSQDVSISLINAIARYEL